MASKVKNNKVNFKGKTVSVGIDMHKISWRITALVEGDTVLPITLARPSYEALKKVLSRIMLPLFALSAENHLRCSRAVPVHHPAPSTLFLLEKQI